LSKTSSRKPNVATALPRASQKEGP
jgi:hypothetical protein